MHLKLFKKTFTDHVWYIWKIIFLSIRLNQIQIPPKDNWDLSQAVDGININSTILPTPLQRFLQYFTNRSRRQLWRVW